MGAIRQAPPWCSSRPRCRSPCAAEQRRTVIDLDRAVGFRRAGERQRIVIGDAVADDAAVGRERGDGRGNRGCRVDGHAQRGRGHAGIAGRIGGSGGQAVGAIRQGRSGVAPGPCPVASGAAEQRGTVIDLDRAVGFRRAGKVSVLSLVMRSPTTPLSVENEAMVGATGAVVSMVTLSALEATPVLPAASVAVAVRLWPPFGGPRWCSSRPQSRSPARCPAASHRHRP